LQTISCSPLLTQQSATFDVCVVDLDVSISSTYLHEAFTPVAPQSVRTQSSCQYLFTLLGSMLVKAVSTTLVKLSPQGSISSTCVRGFFCANRVRSFVAQDGQTANKVGTSVLQRSLGIFYYYGST